MSRNQKPSKGAEQNGAGLSALPFGPLKQDAGGTTKTPLVRLVYQAIMASLDAGKLQPGSRIVASEIASRLGFSRAPVREALAVLAGQGLVELLPDRGAILRPMSARDLAAVYEVSAPVAAIGLREAALRIDRDDNVERILAAMSAIRVAGDETPPSFRFFLVLNEFHYLMNAIAEKPYVDFVLRALNIEYWNRLLTAEINLEWHVTKYVANYQRITDAVLAGDAKSAETIMLYHAEWCAFLLDGDANEDPDRRR
ncbi:GntR family transcriptional regulator [Sphingorhabdus soli]|uniref:GntR family transcriptional regulator n=1 Tax=Flavisphingopyxis soli TaxID=2601267 RepID=A0A5C6UJV2_9SPHN|nr:GntR family transcriptional regulator [Sphingorhabdus soli]TXC73212.1 GntR family transcriptional regulator [Sphingorhabdus soli]